MNDKKTVLNRLCEKRIIAIIRTQTMEKALKITDSLINGGIDTIEFSYTMPFAGKLLETLSTKYSNALLGAGTVLDSITARSAILSGAQYIISPSLNIETANLCSRYGIVYIPGAMTILESAKCLEAGGDIIKVFPSELFGPKIIKHLRDTFPNAILMPSGGVRLDNMDEWIYAGSDIFAISKGIIGPADNDDYESVTKLAKEFTKKLRFK